MKTNGKLNQGESLSLTKTKQGSKIAAEPVRDLNGYVNNLISKTLKPNTNKDSNSKSRLQGIIHPEILFRYNTVNLLTSRKGAGKTYTVMRELIKLSQLPNYGGYTTFIYVTDDETNDQTVNDMIGLIKLKVRQVAYTDLLPVLRDLIDAKNAYSDVISNQIMNDISDSTKKDLFTTLDLTGWTNEIPYTAILLDDAMDILRDNKYKQVRELLFKTRHSQLTVFICVQDLYGVPVSIRRSCDAIFLFSGMTDMMIFNMMMKQLGLKGMFTWEEYQNLPYRAIVVINYMKDGIKIKVNLN
jgi:hypothetical protein